MDLKYLYLVHLSFFCLFWIRGWQQWIFFYPLLLIFNLGFAFRILPLFYFGSAIVGLDFVSFHVLDSDLAAVGLDLVSFSSIYSKVT